MPVIVPSSHSVKKYRKYFPKKGPERKALMFLPNLLKAPKEKRAAIYKKVLARKKGADREALVKYRRIVKTRMGVFNSIDATVREFKKRNPRFVGVILFGGVGKKLTAPTDLDVMIVGELFPSEKKEFLRLLEQRTGLFPDTPAFTINPNKSKEMFLHYLSKELPYFSSPREWTIQNFFGPVEAKRKIMKAFVSAQKQLATKQQLFSEKK